VASIELASLDGRIAPSAETSIPVTDDGLLRGDGVFEVVRVYTGRPFALGRHLDRLERSAESLRLGVAIEREAIEDDAARLLAERGEGWDGQLRILVTRGGRRLLLTEPLPAWAASARLAFVTFGPTHVLDGIKSLSYAANMLAGRLARERGFDEALLVTPHGRVLEAPTASLFFVDGAGRLCTPPLAEHILASITREIVIEVAGEVVERNATRDELLAEAREAFLASTTREVQPVGEIEGRRLAAPGPRTRAIAAGVSERIQDALRAGAR
jgi:branched-chain amino acid aminotransferase